MGLELKHKADCGLSLMTRRPLESPSDPLFYKEMKDLREAKATSSSSEVTEDDVLHAQNLPSFEGLLGQEDSERLLSSLTVPYLRVPLVLSFFTTEDRVAALVSGELQLLLEHVLFEPSIHVATSTLQLPTPPAATASSASALETKGGSSGSGAAVDSKRGATTDTAAAEVKGLDYTGAPLTLQFVPARERRELGSGYGVLLNHLLFSPETPLRAIMELASKALKLDTDDYTCTSCPIILFAARMLARVERYVAYAARQLAGAAGAAGAGDRFAANLTTLRGYQGRLRRALSTRLRDVLQSWERQAQAASDVRSACVLNAHLVLIYAGRSLLPLWHSFSDFPLVTPRVTECRGLTLIWFVNTAGGIVDDPANADATRIPVADVSAYLRHLCFLQAWYAPGKVRDIDQFQNSSFVADLLPLPHSLAFGSVPFFPCHSALPFACLDSLFVVRTGFERRRAERGRRARGAAHAADAARQARQVSGVVLHCASRCPSHFLAPPPPPLSFDDRSSCVTMIA